MKKLVLAVATTALALDLSVGAQAGDWSKIRIGTEGAYPPFNYTDNAGNLLGFDVDIAKALCAQMQVECEFVVQDWDGIIPGLLAKKYDAIIASMSITEERKKAVAFSDKYYQTPAKFVAPEGANIEITKEGLKGKSVAVQRATIHENFLRDNFGDVVDVRAYATQDEANMDLVAGRVDLVLADSVALNDGFLTTDAGKGFEFTGPGFTDPRWFGDGVGIATRKNDTDLVEMFNKAIAAIRSDGTYQKINDSYFNFDAYGE